MSGLNSNSEALAFNYVSSGILAVVNNLWTWLAVLTAAFSFWRVRAAALPSEDQHHRTADIDGSQPELSDTKQPDDRRLDEKPPAVLNLTSVSSPSFNVDGVTKGKFTFHFGDCEGGGNGDADGDGDGEVTAAGEVDGEFGEWYWWKTWERVLMMRNGKDEWYRYQHLTAINGNVVRLWEQNALRLESYHFNNPKWIN